MKRPFADSVYINVLHFLLQNCFDMRHFKHVISILVSEPCMCLSSLGQTKIRHSPGDAIIVILKKIIIFSFVVEVSDKQKDISL